MQTKTDQEAAEMSSRGGSETMGGTGDGDRRERRVKTVVHSGREGVPLGMGISRDRLRRVLRPRD